MTGIQIKIAGEWIELPEDFSISLEQSSPLFNDEGTFSFPFEIPLEPNRKIFRNVDDPFGDITLSDIDRMEAEIWFDGVMLYRGIIETDEEIEFEDTIPVTFLSGNSDFKTRIEGMNAQNVPLDREIKLGYVVKEAFTTTSVSGETANITTYLPSGDLMNFTEANISDPYPVKPYCNVRVCTPSDAGEYVVLEYNRPRSGLCFYVLYVIDCLLKHLGIGAARNDMLEMEDMCRLAFFSTKCEFVEKEGDSNKKLTAADMRNIFGTDFSLTYTNRVHEADRDTGDFSFYARDVYAAEGNFPNVEFKDLFDDLRDIFGVRWMYDTKRNRISFLFVRDIMREPDVCQLDADILACSLQRDKPKPIRVTFGKDNDTAYEYTDYSNVEEKEGYFNILEGGILSYDTTCYIDRTTGNAYRIKVDKNNGGNPSLFEVGGFRDYVTGGTGEEEDSEEITANFIPVAINDTNGRSVLDKAMFDKEEGEQILSVFVDEELKGDDLVSRDLVFSVWPQSFFGPYPSHSLTLEYRTKENYDRDSAGESPLASYDAGYTLGIMRGPGNASGVEYIRTNYDGEGNDSWVQTVANYAFTADSCDDFGRFFDYNGTEAGGADQSGRFSLKLVAEKDGYPIGDNYRNRGLAAKFLSEYLYFMAHRKTVVLTVKMSITQIIGIDFLKRYKVGDYVGFINKISYTLTNYGMEDVTIELYTL